jgi:transposase-like protein
MHWPSTPVEHLGDFQPFFCPRRECPEHQRTSPGYRFRRHGVYASRRRSRVPRFLCLTCGRTFSRQSFAVSYYRKRPELMRPVAAGLVAGSAHRQIARSLGCAPSTVTRLAARLGRHAILLLARALSELGGTVDEPFVLDHFETFEFTQDYPFGVATPVGADSWFVYGLDPAPHARTGHRSAPQRRRLKARPRRAARGGYDGSTRRTLDLLLSLGKDGRSVRIRGDGHPAYDRAVARHEATRRLELERYPNPPRGPKGSPRSAEARGRDQALFPVDLLHKILRHSLAHQRRETIAFGRRLNAVLERLFVAAVWRNFVKRRSERRPQPRTPAMHLGLTEAPWSWKRLLSRRLFHDRLRLPEGWSWLYRRLWTTPVLPSNTRHNLARAF